MYGPGSYHSSQDMLLKVPTIHKTVTEQKLITAWSRELTFFCLEFKDHEGNKKCLSTVIHWTSLKLWKDITEEMMTDIYADMANKSKEMSDMKNGVFNICVVHLIIFSNFWFISHFKFHKKWTGNTGDYRIIPKNMAQIK